MKRLCALLSLLVLAGLIVLPVCSQVNTIPSNVPSPNLKADGDPRPPLPPGAVGPVLVADGDPRPPLPPGGFAKVLA